MNWWQIVVSGVLIFFGHASSMSRYGPHFIVEKCEYIIHLHDRYGKLRDKTSRALTPLEAKDMTLVDMMDKGLIIDHQTGKPLTWSELHYRYPGNVEPRYRDHF